MADQKITELPIKNVSGIQSADYLLGIDSAEGYQMLISSIGEYILDRLALTHDTSAGTTNSVLDKLAGIATSISSINSDLANISPVARITPTAGTNVTINRHNVYRYGTLVVMAVNISVNASFAGNANLVTGLPAPAALTDLAATGGDRDAYVGFVTTSGALRIGGSSTATYQAGTYVFVGAYKTAS